MLYQLSYSRFWAGGGNRNLVLRLEAWYNEPLYDTRKVRVRVVTATSNPSDSWCKSGQMWLDPSYTHWLRTRDSNSELWVMSPICYHYTNPRYILVAGTRFEPVTSRLWASQATSAPPRYLFVLPPGIEPGFYPWKGYVLTDRRQEHFFLTSMSKTVCVFQHYKVNTFFWYYQRRPKKNQSFWDGFL